MQSRNGSFVEVPGGYLYYEASGEGADVVLLNAGAADVRMWDTTVAWLAQTHRVTAMDYRDTGLSSRATLTYSEVDDLAAVLADAGVSHAVLVGCSDGGRRALGFAHRYPEIVQRVVVVGGSFGEFPEPTSDEEAARREMRAHFAQREQALRDGGPPAAAAADIDGWGSALNADNRRRMIGLQLANWYFASLDDYLGVELDPPIKTRLDELSVPVTVLVGEHDFHSTILWARRLVREIADAELEVLPGADHFPMLSHPAAFEASLRRALDHG